MKRLVHVVGLMASFAAAAATELIPNTLPEGFAPGNRYVRKGLTGTELDGDVFRLTLCPAGIACVRLSK